MDMVRNMHAIIISEIDTDNYGAAGNKVSEGWCEEEAGGDKGKGFECRELEMEKAEALLMKKEAAEKEIEEEDKENLKVDLDTGDAMSKVDVEYEVNIDLEKQAMMAIKEQSIELERYGAGGSNTKSGMRKVLEKFPFLRNFSSNDQTDSEESVMNEETSKPDFLDNDLPSYNEATQVEEEKEVVDETDNSVAEENCEQGVSAESLLDENDFQTGNEKESVNNTSENKGDSTEVEQGNPEEATGTSEEEMDVNTKQKSEEKKFRFRFSLFSDKK